MSDETPKITGDITSAERAANSKGSRIFELVHADSRRVVVEVVTGPRLRIVVLGLLTAAIFAGGIGVRGFLASKREAPARRSQPPKPKVVDAIAVQRTSHQIRLGAMASAKPVRSLAVVSQVSGRVVTAHSALRPGGFIKQGETLFELDDTDIKNTISRLAAQINQGKARKRALQAQLKGADKATASARKAVKLTKKQLQRQEELRRGGHVTDTLLDQTRLSVNSQAERLDAAQTNRATLPAQIAQVSAEIAAATASLKQAELDLARTSMTAEFDCQVRSGQIDVGTFVQAGSPVATIESTGSLEFLVPLSVDDVVWLGAADSASTASRAQWAQQLIGQAAVLHRQAPQSDQAYTWRGTIDRVGPGLNARTRMLSLIVKVEETMSEESATGVRIPLLPDMFCRVDIPGRTLNDVIALPSKSVQANNEVYLAKSTEDGLQLERRKVTVAVVQGNTAIITDGLEPGEHVVTTALPKAMAGMPLAFRGQNAPSGVAAR